VEVATLSSVNDGDNCVDRLDMDVDIEPKDVEKFHDV
jgi:hypothetical protein